MSRYLRRPFEDLGEGPTRSTYRYPDPDLNSRINHRDGEGRGRLIRGTVFAGGGGIYSNDTRSVWLSPCCRGRPRIPWESWPSQAHFSRGTKIRMRYEEARLLEPATCFLAPSIGSLSETAGPNAAPPPPPPPPNVIFGRRVPVPFRRRFGMDRDNRRGSRRGSESSRLLRLLLVGC